MDMSSALEFEFEVGWSLIGVGMAVVVHAGWSGIGLERALNLRGYSHLRVVGNGTHPRVLVAALQGGALRCNTALNLRRLRT
jgi:hypothetical protein